MVVLNRICLFSVLSCLFFNFSNKLNAQELSLNFFHLSKQNGLSDNSVNAIVNDTSGFMWFGTNMGLNRYDGNEFVTFYADTTKNTLPDNIIENLYVAKSGELWLSTNNNGVSLFNQVSQNFINYNFEKENHSLAANRVTDIVEDSDTILFIGTGEGLYYKLPGSNEFNEIKVGNPSNPDSFLLKQSISAVTEDENYGIWIAYDDFRFTYYHHKEKIIKHYAIKDLKNDFGSTLIATIEHVNKKLWIGTDRYILVCFDPEDNSYEEPLKEEKIISFHQILKGTEKNILWMATSDGLVRYNLNSGEFFRYTNILNDLGSLTTTTTRYVHETPNNIIWVTNYNSGLNYAFKNMPFKHIHVNEGDDYALSVNNITSILHDDRGDTWFGYTSGSIELYKTADQKKYKIPITSLTDKGTTGTIFKLFQDSDGKIYACSWRGGVQIFDKKNQKFVPLLGSSESFLNKFNWADFRDIEEYKDGEFWLAAHGKGVFVFNKNTDKAILLNVDSGLANDWVYDIAIDSSGNTWLGTAWGLSKFDRQSKEITNYLSAKNDSLSISNNNTTYVTVSRDNNIWIGTNDGLNLYDKKIDGFHRFGIESGLPEIQIKSLVQDYSGAYWVSTTNGIIKFNLSTTDREPPYLNDIYFFTSYDGLQSNYYNLSSSSIDNEGKIFFGGRVGIDYFDPELIQPYKSEPKLKILDFEIYGKKVYPGSQKGPYYNKNGYVQLGHKQKMLGFKFVAINFSNVNRNKYSYSLEPLSTDWINVGNNRSILFSNLKPGEYKLSLKVTTDKGLTGVSKNIVKFYIKPPFWQTTWFYSILFLLTIGLITFIIRIYTNTLRKKKITLEKIVHRRTLDLKQNNQKLEEQSLFLNETNTLLEERQQQIEEQAEELKAQSEKLAKSNEELEKLIALKDKFFSIIAHDLKNPFNTILGFADLLKHNFQNYSYEKRQQLVEYIFNSASSAYSLLENLLNWSRSQTSRLEVNPQMLLVEEIIEANYNLLQSTLKKKGLEFKTNYDKNIKIWADEALINTVFRNILSNAAKFTSSGGTIIINAFLEKDSFVKFEINDTGTGLTKDEIDSIFRIESMVSKPGTSGEKGTGLGMILCKEFIEKLDGKIWIESEPNVGTSVYFTIPAEPTTDLIQ